MNKQLIPRDRYLSRVMAFKDRDLVKVVTGVRRCGKSSLLELVRAHIENSEAHAVHCASINLEVLDTGVTTGQDLYRWAKDAIDPNKRNYLFIDEVQRIEGWQDPINSLRAEGACDLYVTGSNAYLLSSEITTYLSGRYVEIKMLPLSFREFLNFNNIDISEDDDLSFLIDSRGTHYLTSNLFMTYLTYGGMPEVADLNLTGQWRAYIESLYESVVVRDVLNRERRASERFISNRSLLEALCRFLADNVGNLESSKKIADYLSSSGIRTTDKTVTAYIRALRDAYLFYKANQYDLRGKKLLANHPKDYIVDLGLRNFLCGNERRDLGRILENAVYLELLYQGFDVFVGRVGRAEVDFVAMKDGSPIYLQVCDSLQQDETRDRELAPLYAIKDFNRRAVIVRQEERSYAVDGIPIIAAHDFFLRDFEQLL